MLNLSESHQAIEVTFGDIENLLEDTIGLEEGVEVTEDSSLVRDLGLSGLDLLQLHYCLRHDFGVQITAAALAKAVTAGATVGQILAACDNEVLDKHHFPDLFGDRQTIDPKKLDEVYSLPGDQIADSRYGTVARLLQVLEIARTLDEQPKTYLVESNETVRRFLKLQQDLRSFIPPVEPSEGSVVED